VTALRCPQKSHPSPITAQTMADIRSMLAVRPMTAAEMMEHLGLKRHGIKYPLELLHDGGVIEYVGLLPGKKGGMQWRWRLVIGGGQ
jgi:predicted ArsR family transcriptional regulator